MEKLKSYPPRTFFKDVIKGFELWGCWRPIKNDAFINNDEYIGNRDFIIRKSFLTDKQLLSLTKTVSKNKTHKTFSEFNYVFDESLCVSILEPLELFNRVQMVGRKIYLRTEDLKYWVNLYCLLWAIHLYSKHESIYTWFYLDKSNNCLIVSDLEIGYIYLYLDTDK